MYSENLRNQVFRILKEPECANARSPLKGTLLFEELERNSFIDNELGEKEAIAIASLVERFGEVKAMQIVAGAKNSLVFTRGEFSESGGAPISKKKAKKTIKKRSAAPAKPSVSDMQPDQVLAPARVITEYALVEANNPDKLSRDVNRMIRSGWEPLGGISVAVRERPNTEVLWSQAMVQRD